MHVIHWIEAVRSPAGDLSYGFGDRVSRGTATASAKRGDWAVRPTKGMA